MDDKTRLVNFYNQLISIYNNMGVISNNMNNLIDCLDSNFTVNDRCIERDAIVDVQSKLLSVRDNLDRQLLEFIDYYI